MPQAATVIDPGALAEATGDILSDKTTASDQMTETVENESTAPSALAVATTSNEIDFDEEEENIQNPVDSKVSEEQDVMGGLTTAAARLGVADGEEGLILDDDNGIDKEKETHLEKEAELEAYLDSLKPKPKKKSLKEMLATLPNFKKDFKPQLGGGGAEKKGGGNFIILDDDEEPKRLTRSQRKIEELKARFVRQVMTAPPKPVKGEHVKLKIQKKEEDSQGIEHLIEGEVEYIRNPLNEEEEANNFLAEQKIVISPQQPGANRQQFRKRLLDQIAARKLKEHEERVKTYAMYNDEIDTEDKEEEIEEEGDDMSEGEEDSDVEDEEEEEEIEVLLGGSKNKKKKSAFVEEEAEDEDGSDDGDDEDDDDDDSSGSEDDSEKDSNVADLENLEDDVTTEKSNGLQSKNKEVPLESEDSESKTFEATTPKFSAADLKPRTPADMYSTIPTSLTMKSQSLSESTKEANVPPPTLPESLANVISETETKFDDLVDLCSGKFVTQTNSAGLAESQEEDEEEFANFDFGDNDKLSSVEKDNEDEKREEAVRTPLLEKLNSSKTAIDGHTPKLNEKIPKTRKLFEQRGVKEAEVELTSDNADNNEMDAAEDSDDEEVIGRRKQVRKKKRLQFSDDEDDDGNNEQPVSAPPSEDELSETEEQPLEEDYAVEEQEKPQGLFFNKHGRLKRKFVEDEAELSGSEEGSADEDERGLNRYEMEEGDDEELDLSDVQNQVERAHLKQLLDEDDRHIRYLQNQYLENGDLHSDKQRERKFKWLDMSALNDDAHMGDSDEEQTEENPEEDSLKQAWVEKRKWMTENSHLLEPDVDESQSLFSNSRFVKIGKSTLKKIESFVECSSDSKDLVIKENSKQRRSIYEEILKSKSEAKKAENKTSAEYTSFSEGFGVQGGSSNGVGDKSALSQPMFGEQMWSKTSSDAKKGSFLSRGGMMLAKLAETSKPADAVSNVKNNSRNFVFTHITPPNQEKGGGSTSRVKRIQPKTLACGAQAKKIKVDRSFHNLDEASKGNSIFKYL